MPVNPFSSSGSEYYIDKVNWPRVITEHLCRLADYRDIADLNERLWMIVCMLYPPHRKEALARFKEYFKREAARAMAELDNKRRGLLLATEEERSQLEMERQMEILKAENRSLIMTIIDTLWENNVVPRELKELLVVED